MATRHSSYERAAHDFYSEPAWVADAVLDYLQLDALHDPCCGFGTIATAALRRGIQATGADIIDRACGLFPTQDFLTDEFDLPGNRLQSAIRHRAAHHPARARPRA